MDEPRKPRPGSMSDADRALAGAARRRTPVDGIPEHPWHEEHTGVHTDVQVFRALKSLHGEIQANKSEAAKAHGALSSKVAALAAEVSGIRTTVVGFDEKLDRVAESSAKTAGALEVIVGDRRSKSPSTETRTIAQTVVTETLATQVLQERREEQKTAHQIRVERWKFAGKLVAGTAAVVEILHRTGVL